MSTQHHHLAYLTLIKNMNRKKNKGFQRAKKYLKDKSKDTYVVLFGGNFFLVSKKYTWYKDCCSGR